MSTVPLMYSELVGWYALIDPPVDHADEARCYREALERGVSGRAETLLELGAGGGNNAFHLKERFRCTLTDLTPAMSALSRELNPDCEHELGDMRTLRLGRLFDTVLVHDAVMYMLTEADLRATAETAFAHTRPGGAAVFAPDYVRESFREGTNELGADDATRALRGLEWVWDPDPRDDTYVVDYAFMLRENGTVRTVHDHHTEGLFSRPTWVDILRSVGFGVETFSRPIDEREFDEVFLCRRPSGP